MSSPENGTENRFLTGGLPMLVNVLLNIIWIPKFGISGAAWASTVSYGVALVAHLYNYCKLSGNHWSKVVLPQAGDGATYLRTAKELWQSLWAKHK